MRFDAKKIFYIIFGILLAEAASFLSYLHPALRPWSFAAVSVLFFILAARNFRLAFFVLLAELFIGSKGYLFYLEFEGINLSARIAFFLIILAVWFAGVFVGRFEVRSFLKSGFFYPYLALLAVVAFGTVRGAFFGNAFQDIFFDANGYFYLALAPIFFGILKTEEGGREVFNFLFAAAIWVSVKTIFLLFAVSYFSPETAYKIYRWVRTTGIGEITAWSGGFYRVFIQSQIYAVFALLVLVFGNFSKKFYYFCGALFFSAIFVSLSRSFEVGLLAAIILGFVFVLLKHRSAFFLLFVRLAIVAAIGFLLVGLVNNGFFGAASGRAAELGGGAALTRLAELGPLWEQIKKNPVLGSGFGTTLAFKSLDPRVLQSNSSGDYTTYAFEWGYLDILMKLGIVGITIYGWFIWRIARDFWRKKDGDPIYLGLFLGLIALLAINIFSPYLNHPLGIGYLMLLMGFLKSPDNGLTEKNVI